MAKKFSYQMHQDIITTHYRMGTRVSYPNVPGERQYHGIVECEKSTQPGFYYIRNEETGMLDLVYWCYMHLARREEVAQ